MATLTPVERQKQIDEIARQLDLIGFQAKQQYGITYEPTFYREGDAVPGFGTYNPTGGFTQVNGQFQDNTPKPQQGQAGYDPFEDPNDPRSRGSKDMDDEGLRALEDFSNTTGQPFSAVPQGGYKPPPPVSSADAAGLLSEFGLGGIVDPKDLIGQYPGTAREIIKAKKKELEGTTSSLTSTAYNQAQFNPQEAMKALKFSSDKFRLSLDDAKNNAWYPNEEREQKTKDAIETTSQDIADQFPDPQNFLDTYKTDPNFIKFLKDFIKAGGTTSQILDKIKAKVTGETGNNQSVMDYVTGKYKEKAALDADIDLDDERTTAKADIMKQLNIPKQYEELYFGKAQPTEYKDLSNEEFRKMFGNNQTGAIYDPKTDTFSIDKKGLEFRKANGMMVPEKTDEEKGLFTLQKEKAQQKIEKANAEFAESKKSIDDLVRAQEAKNAAETDIKLADIEENREKTREYMTVRLAQLGALTTTGAAPEALAKIEAKYDKMKFDAKNKLSEANNNLMVKKLEAITKIKGGLSDTVEKIQNDLDKDEEKIKTDILKAQTKADAEIEKIQKDYNTESKKVYKDFEKTAEKTAEDWTKAFFKTISGGLSEKYLAEVLPSFKGKAPGLTPTQKTTITQSGLKDQKAIDYFLNTPNEFQDLWNRGRATGTNAKTDLQSLVASYTAWYNSKQKKAPAKFGSDTVAPAETKTRPNFGGQ